LDNRNLRLQIPPQELGLYKVHDLIEVKVSVQPFPRNGKYNYSLSFYCSFNKEATFSWTLKSAGRPDKKGPLRRTSWDLNAPDASELLTLEEPLWNALHVSENGFGNVNCRSELPPENFEIEVRDVKVAD
jgi:hypothetical protein